jgi:peptide/nickel transport system substrate-binding protein
MKHLTVTQRLLLAATLATGSLIAATGAFAQQKVLTVGSAFVPISLDPALSGNGRAGMAIGPAYEPLVRVAADGSFRPALATKWEIAPDSKSVTFTLRQDAKFSDGEPVTAEAAKKSIEYFRHKVGNAFATNLQTVTSIDVLGPYQFRINVSAPQPALINLFEAYWNGGMLISPKGVDNPDGLAKDTAGAGPYKLDPSATILGKSYTYVPNPLYYDKSRIKWDKVVISVFQDQNAGLQAMKAGQLMFLSSDPLTANSNAANLPANLRIVSEPVAWTGLILSDRNGDSPQPALKDVRVRQAINYALDRKLMTQALFGKFAEPSAQLQARGFVGYDARLEERYPYDPAKAKALLAEAGYPNGLELPVAYVNNSMSQFLQQAVGAQLRKVGITVKGMEAQSFGVLNSMAANKTFAAVLLNSNSGLPNLAKFQVLDAKGGFNYYFNTDEALTKLMDEASNLPVDKAEDTWKKVYGRVVEIAWTAPVAAIHVAYFASNTIKTPPIGQSVVIDLTDIEPAN